MTVEESAPNLTDLAGEEIKITYSVMDAEGKTLFSFFCRFLFSYF